MAGKNLTFFLNGGSTDHLKQRLIHGEPKLSQPTDLKPINVLEGIKISLKTIKTFAWDLIAFCGDKNKNQLLHGMVCT